jgi:hypothetical protein
LTGAAGQLAARLQGAAMINLQNVKFVAITPPAAIVDNDVFVTAALDTKGWDYAVILILFGAMDIAMAALKLQHSEASDMSGATDVTGGNFATSGTLPADTADNTFVAWYVDCRNKKRYLDVVATGGNGSAGTYMTAIAILGRGEQQPSTAALRGLAQQLIV